MRLLILSTTKDGEIVFQAGKYQYRVWLDAAHIPFIKKWMYRKPGMIMNFMKRKGTIERYDPKGKTTE